LKVGKPRLKDNLLSLLFTPDEFLGWFPFALIASWKAVSAYRPVCIITTGPPHTAHLVALVLKLLRKIPWILDLRDPWSWHDLPASRPRQWKDSINAWLEDVVISATDRVVCVSEGVTAEYRERFRGASADKWYTITNGFDLDEFKALGEVVQARRFTISHVGTLDFERTPQLLLQAVAELIASGEIERSRVAIRFIGSGEFASGRSLVELIGDLGLVGVAQIVPPVPRPEALRELLRSHVLLLIAGTQRLSIAAKLFEYLASGRPILAIGDDWAAAHIVRKLGAGRVVAPHDLDGAKEAVRDWYGRFVSGERCLPPGVWENLPAEALEYSWESLGGRYSQLIEQLSPNPRLSTGVQL
jgi:glycosyltransferase involved in cell wall biosynthesis